MHRTIHAVPWCLGCLGGIYPLSRRSIFCFALSRSYMSRNTVFTGPGGYHLIAPHILRWRRSWDGGIMEPCHAYIPTSAGLFEYSCSSLTTQDVFLTLLISNLSTNVTMC